MRPQKGSELVKQGGQDVTYKCYKGMNAPSAKEKCWEGQVVYRDGKYGEETEDDWGQLTH